MHLSTFTQFLQCIPELFMHELIHNKCCFCTCTRVFSQINSVGFLGNNNNCSRSYTYLQMLNKATGLGTAIPDSYTCMSIFRTSFYSHHIYQIRDLCIGILRYQSVQGINTIICMNYSSINSNLRPCTSGLRLSFD